MEGEETRKPRSRARVLVSRLRLLLGALIVSLLVIELVLHAVGYWPEISSTHFLSNKERVPDARAIMVRPEFRADTYYGSDDPSLRIVALGDSFTEGFPVGRSKSYPAVLERLLRAEGRDARVVNMGMGDSGPDQHLRLLKAHVLPRFTPDVVVWVFYWNDLGDMLRYPVHEVRGGELVPLDASEHWIHRRQRVFDAIPLPKGLKRKSAIVRAGMKSWEAVHRPRIEYTAESLRPAAARLRLVLREMERLAATHGFRVVYALIARQRRYLRALDPAAWPAKQDPESAALLRMLLVEEAPLVDVYFVDAVEAARAGEPQHAPPGFGLFVDAERDHGRLGQHHFNEEGYRRLAETLREHLDLPAPSRRD